MAVPFLTPKDFDVRPGIRSDNGDCTRIVALRSDAAIEMLSPDKLNTLGNIILSRLNQEAEMIRHNPHDQTGPKSLVLFSIVYPCGVRASKVDSTTWKAISKFCRRQRPATTRKQERRIERHHSDRELRVASFVEM